MADLLDMDYINSLPQPLFAVDLGNGWLWPVYDIEVETGLFRIDVCGLLEVKHIGGFLKFEDANGVRHDTDTFYSDYDRTQEQS
jgi:hypothetical protein